MRVDEMIVVVKQAANALYAVGWSDRPIDPEDRQKLRLLSERLDAVTQALGGNPMTPAWDIPGNPRVADGFPDRMPTGHNGSLDG